MTNSQDLAFVQQATASGLAEVTEGQLASGQRHALVIGMHQSFRTCP